VWQHCKLYLGIWNHRCVEKVHEERVAAEKKLNDVVAKLYTNFAIEKAHAIEVTRKEEQDQATKEKEKLRRFSAYSYY